MTESQSGIARLLYNFLKPIKLFIELQILLGPLGNVGLKRRYSKEKSDCLIEHNLITRVHNQRRCYHLLLVEFNIFLGRSVYYEDIKANTISVACIHAHNSQLSRARNIFRKETPIE